jgi:hypothetical protein
MKMQLVWLATAVVLTLAGCGGSERVDTGGLEVAFEMVPATNRTILDRTLADIRASRVPEAVAGLRELERRYRLNPRQELAVKTLLRELEPRLPAAGVSSVPEPGGATNRPAGVP